MKERDAAVGFAGDQAAVARPIVRATRAPCTLVGTLTPRDHAVLAAGAAGRIVALAVDVGSVVRSGAILATLALPDVQQQQLQSATMAHLLDAQLIEARAEADRYARTPAAPDRAYLAAKVEAAAARVAQERATRERLDALLAAALLRAPFDGVVSRRFVGTGAQVTREAPVVELVALDPLRLGLDVPGWACARLRVGAEAVVRVPGVAVPVPARVARFAAVLDPASGCLRVEVDVPNAEHRLAAGLRVAATLDLGEHDGLFVPRTAVRSDAAGDRVVVVADGRATWRTVAVIGGDAVELEIGHGLVPGERVLARADEDVLAQPADAIDE